MSKLPTLLISGLAALLLPAASHAATSGLVVLELFTSQGCSSCPPADRLLGELASDYGNVIALSYHVDYWNYIGWQDPFSSAAFSRYQRRYASAQNSRRVYTPQMMINGHRDVVGSQRNNVLSTLVKAKADLIPVDVESSYDAATQKITVDMDANTNLKHAEMVVVTYKPSATTSITRGENRGETLTNHHIVTSIQSLGNYDGTAQTLIVPRPADEHAVMLLRDPSAMKILAAARL